MFPKVGFPGRSKCTANSILRKNVAYFVEFFRCAVRLVKNQLISSVFPFTVKSIVYGKETVHSMRSGDDIVKSWEGIQTDQPYRILGSL